MPTIRHRTGPLAGKEQTIDPRVDRITFGRDPSACDVVFPPDLTLVSRRHFALYRTPAGQWMYEDFGDPFVAVNGHPAETDEGIPSGAVIELGKIGGPSFEVVFEGKEFAPGLKETTVQQKALGARQQAAKARRMAMAGATVAALAVVIAGGAWYLTQSQGAKFEQQYGNWEKERQRLAEGSIPGSVADKLNAAAHVVAVQFAGGQVVAHGSASPIGPDLLVTNAHVAEIRNTLRPGDKLFVRAPGAQGKTYEVIETIIHPGYKAFKGFLNEDPIFVTSARSCPTCFPSLLSASLSYDVALLRVAPGSNLGPILEVATKQELHALRAGQALALSGYPLEYINGSELMALGATPNYRTGVISAITDMFVLPGDIEHQRLIHHNIPVTGGNSGSPMVASNGKLVALLNSGNMLPREGGGRMPNAAVVNYGQRADLVHDLLDKTADANLQKERDYWAKQTATFQRGRDLLVPAILEQTKPPNAVKPNLVSEAKFTLTSGDSFKAKDATGKETSRRQKIHSFSLKSKVPGIFIAYAQERAAIQLYLVVNGNIVQQDNRGTWFPFVRYNFDQDTTAEVYVVSPDSDVNYTLLQYSWDPPPS